MVALVPDCVAYRKIDAQLACVDTLTAFTDVQETR